MSMMIAFCGLFAMAQASAPAIHDDSPIPDLTEALSPPPMQIQPRSKCSCPAEPEQEVLIQVTLAADGLSPADRQATIFNITRSGNHDLKGRTKIWHSTIRNQCGVTFDYGRKYKLSVRMIEGAIDTDACLMRQAAPLGTITLNNEQ